MLDSPPGRPSSDQNAKNIQVRCPKCGKRGRWLGQGYAPFCSERCKLIDMGRWFKEDYRVSEPLRPDHFSEYENLPMNSDPDQMHHDRS